MSRPLEDILAEAQQSGLIGPEPIEQAIEHATGFGAGVLRGPERLLDLGSGGGLPGLPLAERWTSTSVILLDSVRRRADFLQWAVDQLGLSRRVGVVRARAEEAAHEASMRGTFDAVVARAFGGPATTAECAAGFLRVGGWLVVSEPPGDPHEGDGDQAPGLGRWLANGLAKLGMEVGPRWGEPYHYQAVRQVAPCPQHYPRQVGIPAKRPLW
jgi:16S rRNA (guanine527-N7)-methyltransferase